MSTTPTAHQQLEAQLLRILERHGDSTPKQLAKVTGEPSGSLVVVLEKMAGEKRVQKHGRYWRVVQTPKPVETPAERMARHEQYVRRDLERVVEDHRARVQRLIDQISAPGSAGISNTVYQLRWGDALAATAFQAEVAFHIMNPAEGESIVDLFARCQYWRDRLREALLRNEYRGGSSSQFHNAVMASSAEAASNIYRKLQSVCEMHADNLRLLAESVSGKEAK